MSAPNNSPSQNPRNPFPAWRLKNGVMNATDGELGASSESCELWGWRCGALVVAGVVAEFVIAFANPPYGSFLERYGNAVADAFVALGVVGEIMFARMGHTRQNELTRRSEDRLAQVEFDNGAIEVNLERATDGLASAQRKLADAIERAANAERETALLKAKFSWRDLSLDEAKRLGSALAALPVKAMTVHFPDGNSEAFMYAEQIAAVFRQHGWHVVFIAAEYRAAPVFGIRVPAIFRGGALPTAHIIRSALETARIDFIPGDAPNPEAFKPFPQLASNPEKLDWGVLYVGPKFMGTSVAEAKAENEAIPNPEKTQ